MKNTVNIKEVSIENFQIPIKGEKFNVIKLLPHNLVTEHAVKNVEDLVVEDFGLQNGAIASTVAHDSHNLIVIGDNDEDMLMAVKELERVGGGLTIVSEGKVLDTLALTIAGLMSEEPLEVVDERLNNMPDVAYERLKVNKNIDPFMTLSFIALPVIPDIKITDMGLFNVSQFKFIDLVE